MRYYLDTCIWRDYVEEREGYQGRPLGKNAVFLIAKLISQKAHIYHSPVVLEEIRYIRSKQRILELMHTLTSMRLLYYIPTDATTYACAVALAKERGIPIGDSHHALLAQKVKAIIISTDPHFDRVSDIVTSKIPEGLL